MPISPAKVARRMAELGRVRAGAKQGGNGRPMKLDTFRFTSPTQRYITDIAALYGGEPRPWDNNGKPEFEVFTDAKAIPVIAVKGGLSQWMETWSGGGCVHRCDGERDVEGNLCDPDDPKHVAAKPTTRLSVMLPELEAIGMWRLESHGWNAAAEIPAVAELAQFVGDLVPATLNLVERRSVKDGQTSRFVVPVLDLQIGTARLRELVAQKAGLELEAPASVAAAIEAPAESSDLSAYSPLFAKLGQAKSIADLTDLWTEAREANLVGSHLELVGPHAAFVDAWKVAAHKFRGAEQQAAEPVVDEDGAVDAVIVEDPPGDAPSAPDPDTLWQQIITVGGRVGMTLPEITDDCSKRLGGVLPQEATGDELGMYLKHLQLQEQQAVAS